MGDERWGNEEDAKLPELFRAPHNSADPTKLGKDAAKAVWRKHFPTGDHRNFAPSHRSKARDFNVSRTLDGHRKSESPALFVAAFAVAFADISSGSAAAEAQHQAESIEEDSDSSDGDFGSEDEAEEDIELDDNFVNEGPQEEEEEAMPSATPKKKRPSRKSRVAPTPDPAPAGEDVTTASRSMSLSGFKPFSMGHSFPFIITTFNEDFDIMCKAELHTPLLPKEFFNLETSSGGSVLDVQCQVPSMLPDETRVVKVNKSDKSFTKSTHEAQSHKEVCESIDDHCPNGFHMGDPQRIALPFTCEERIDSWECQAYNNDLLIHEFGGTEADGDEAFPEQQCHNVVVVTLRKLRTERKTSGVFRKVD